jgi:protein SCO1/2
VPGVASKRVLLACLAIVVAAAVVLFATFLTRPPDPKLDDLGVVPAFHLLDERGQPFTEEALRGHITIVSFIFTRCDTICPVTSMKMAHLQEQTFDVGDKVKLLSFSVDPGYDTPPRLAAYAQRFGADPTRWRFVTGQPDRVKALIEGPFMTSTQVEGTQADGAPNIAHGGYFLLVDPTLHIRGSFSSNDRDRLDELGRAARFLARTML